jgi:type III secretion protein SpaR/YscT/HrcT
MEDLWSILRHPELKAAMQMASLVFARLLPIVVLTPVFGGQMMPKRLRMGLTFVFTVALVPALLPAFRQPVGPLPYAALLAKEAVIGLSLAIFLFVLFEALAAVGALVDLSRGATMANVLDPLTQNQESILAVFFTQLAIVLFLSIGGIQLLMRALGDGFALLRPQDLLPPSVVGPSATETPIGLVANLFAIALRLGAPAIVVVLLLDFGLAVINRIAPQVQVHFLGMTLKGTIGVLIVLLAFGLTADLIVTHFGDMLRGLRAWMTSIGS